VSGPPTLSVVVATYEQAPSLDAVLRALSDQSDVAFEIVVADDGSGPETARLVERWRSRFGGRLQYAFQPDEGYRLARVRNLGASLTSGELLVFMDGDVVPRRHFVRTLRRSGRAGWFVAGKRVMLSRDFSERALGARLRFHRWTAARWGLLHRSDADGLEALVPRDRRRVGRTGLPEFVPHAGGYGFLLGVWRDDFERVNGYDMRYVGWGAEDVDMGVRLHRLGLRCGWAGPQSALFHLWHETRKHGPRPNKPFLADTESGTRIRAIEGLAEL